MSDDQSALTSLILEELRRRELPHNLIAEAEQLLMDETTAREIFAKATAGKIEIEKATDTVSKIDALVIELISLRYRINEASKIMGKRIFEDNSETSRISHALKENCVTDEKLLRDFVFDIHKFIIESATWGELYKSPHVQPIIKIIETYRNSYAHIIDMKGSGSGASQAYATLGDINEELLGHKVVKIDEYPRFQIEILGRVVKMLSIIDENIEEWLS